MLAYELTVRIDRIRATSMLPIAILPQLSNPRARLPDQLTFRVVFDELTVGLEGVGGFGCTPILLLTAAACY
jgi:hypothetical protein